MQAQGGGHQLTQDPALPTILEIARQIAGSAANVIISGESGTGEELLARLIHDHSPSRTATFLAVNCGAFPEGLLANELFGRHRCGMGVRMSAVGGLRVTSSLAMLGGSELC